MPTLSDDIVKATCYLHYNFCESVLSKQKNLEVSHLVLETIKVIIFNLLRHSVLYRAYQVTGVLRVKMEGLDEQVIE